MGREKGKMQEYRLKAVQKKWKRKWIEMLVFGGNEMNKSL